MEKSVSTASQPLDDGSESPTVDIDALYFEALGGEKMRHVYGLRSQAIFIYLASFQSSAISYPSQTASSAAQVREIVQQKVADTKAEMERESDRRNSWPDRI